MMIRINLLPVRAVKKREMGRQVLVLFALVLIGAGVGNWMWYSDRDAELQRLYEFDLSVLQDVEDLEALVAAVPNPGGEDPAKALEQVQQRVRVLEDKWKQRELVISNVVQAGSQGA